MKKEQPSPSITQLRMELDQAKEHLRQSTFTFSQVGRLHQFLKDRGKARESSPQAPGAAMKYINQLEKACRIAARALSDPTADREAALSTMLRVLPPETGICDPRPPTERSHSSLGQDD